PAGGPLSKGNRQIGRKPRARRQEILRSVNRCPMRDRAHAADTCGTLAFQTAAPTMAVGSLPSAHRVAPLPMSPEGSGTHWLGPLKAGDAAAAQPLWERYFRRLAGLARKKLQGSPRLAADGEDVAQSAFKSFYRGAEQGRFPDLRDRDDLWRLL